MWAGEASECANTQGRFWDYHDKLFNVRARGGQFGKSDLKRYAEELGLVKESFNTCLDSGRHAQKVKDDTAEGRRMGVQAVPTFFINGRKVEGVASYTVFRSVIEEELSKEK